MKSTPVKSSDVKSSKKGDVRTKKTIKLWTYSVDVLLKKSCGDFGMAPLALLPKKAGETTHATESTLKAFTSSLSGRLNLLTGAQINYANCIKVKQQQCRKSLKRK